MSLCLNDRLVKIIPFPESWSNTSKISHLQRRVLIYSIAYYEYSESIVSDIMYDAISKQLVQMQREFPDEAAQSMHWYAMKDFEGSTGFDLMGKLTNKDREWLRKLTQFIMKLGG